MQEVYHGEIFKKLFCILIIISILTSCNLNLANTESNKIIDNKNKATEEESDNNKISDDNKVLNNFDYSLVPQNLVFDKHGPINEKNAKFNPSTGDVLYISGNIYPPYRQEKNNPNDYDFLGEDYNKIEHKYDETEKFLYLRNIYTQEMFLVDKIELNNEKNYTFNFTKDNQIEINEKIITKNIKTQENFVYAECNSTKSSFIEKDSDVINNALKIDKEVTNKVLSHIKDNYNIDSKALLTLSFNNVSYIVVNIPNFYISMENKYVQIDDSSVSSVELWKYENNECKRLLYNQMNLSIYNMIRDKGYLMILGYEGNPGYIIKFDKNNSVLYESKFKGFSKSPDDKYIFLYNLDESFAVVENDKMIINHNLRGNDDVNTFWYKTIDTMGLYWWDMEFNKLYVLVNPQINPVAYIYCVDLNSKEVNYYGSIKYRHWVPTINKELSYVCSENSGFNSGGDAEIYCKELFIHKKYSNYLYNLRTNEKFYLSDGAIYKSIEINDNFIKYTQSKEDDIEPIELKIDISQYIDKNRINYVNKIKNSIIESYNNNVNADNIELSLTFNTTQGKYEIVKINQTDNYSYYELWKIGDNKFEKLFDKTDNIFLTNNQEYLCTISKDGELKIYDKNFGCIMNKNIYSENLLKRYNLESLEIGDYYVMKFDKNIFITIKNHENLVDVVNIDLVNKKMLSIDYELNCHYDNHFINPVKGYLIYQTGPSVIKNDNLYIQDTLTSINLITMQQKTISKDELREYIVESN